MVGGHVLHERVVLVLPAGHAPVLADELAVVVDDHLARGDLGLQGAADQRVGNRVVHVVDGDVVIWRDLGVAPPAHLVALQGQRQGLFGFLCLEQLPARPVLRRERAAVEPRHPLGAELVELLEGVEAHFGRRRHDEHVHLRRLAGYPVRELGGVARPVYVGLLARGVPEVLGRAQPLGRRRELLAEALVRVRELPLGQRGGAVLQPELLDGELVALLLALHVGLHVRLQVGASFFLPRSSFGKNVSSTAAGSMPATAS